MFEDLRPLRRRTAGDGDLLGPDEPHRVVGRPRSRADHERRRPRELLPDLRHVPRVRERRGDQPPVERRGHHTGDVTVARRLSWSNHAPLGMPVVPLVQMITTGSAGAKPRPLGAQPVARFGSIDRGRVGAPRRRQHRRHRPATRCPGTCAPGSHSTTVGAARSRIAAASVQAEPGVDAGGNPTGQHDRAVGHCVPEPGRQQDRHDVACGDAPAHELAGQGVGASEPLAERPSLTGRTVDVGGARRELDRGRLERIGGRGEVADQRRDDRRPPGGTLDDPFDLHDRRLYN